MLSYTECRALDARYHASCRAADAAEEVYKFFDNGWYHRMAQSIQDITTWDEIEKAYEKVKQFRELFSHGWYP